MGDAETPAPDNRAQIEEALRLGVAGDNEQAVNLLQPLADEGDLVAALLITQYIWSAPAGWVAGIPYAQQVAAAGIPYHYLTNYVGHMLNDATHREAGIELARNLMAAGLGWDMLGNAHAAVQAGDGTSAVRMMEVAALPSPSGAGRAWQQLLTDAQRSLETIKFQEADASKARTSVTAAMTRHERAVDEERQRIQNLVEQVGALVHDVSAHQLAREYADQAQREGDTAQTYTRWALGVAGVTALVTLVVAGLLVFGDFDAENVLAKASLAIPLLGFAAYIGKLAGDHRRMAWHWRHVELQIRTADPFIAPLEEAPRKALLAALALRLFPGQPADPQRGGEEAPDPTEFLTELAKPAPSAPPPPQQ